MADLKTISGWGTGTWNGIDSYGFTDQGSTLRFVDQEKTVSTNGEGLSHETMTVADLSGIEILFELDNENMSFAAWLFSTSGASGLVSYQAEGINGFRIYRSNDYIHKEYSTDGGATWIDTGAASSISTDDGWALSFTFGGMLTVSKIQGFVYGEGGDPGTPNVHDPFLPNAIAPAKAGTGCATLLDMIREFSSQVRRSVRITGPTSITMIDPNLPLAGDLVPSDADAMYSQASQQLTADEVSLTALKGRLALSMGAEMVTNDLRAFNAGWRIPERLPVCDLDPAAVQRVSYTFTPTEFRGSVEFRAATVPLTVRR